MGGLFRIPKNVDLKKRLERIKESIRSSMGVELRDSDAFRVLIWKTDISKAKITKNKLFDILHGK